ncbi:YdcF family protein [Streptomyces capparidis]
MFAYAAGLCFLVFCVRFLRESRRFSNAVLLGLTLALLTLHLLERMARGGEHSDLLAMVLLAGSGLAGLGALMLPFFLIANGMKMARKEGRNPANLLSLLAGLGLLGTYGFTVAALFSESPAMHRTSGALVLVVGYVSFLFLCFVGYGFLYGHLRIRRRVDFVVVLGSGLIGGSRVPPLLAARLERGRKVYERQARRGRPPVVVVSGGQGPDEDVPEAHAMADHLLARGVPEEHLVREDRSRTTEENLLFSKAIMAERGAGHRCLIVTNNYHVFRAALTARRVGVNGQVMGARTAAYFLPSATIREFAAIFLHHRAVNLGLCAVLALLGAVLSS